MKVKSSHLKKLTQWESFQFLDDFLDYAENHTEISSELFNAQLSKFSTAFEVFDKELVQEGKNTSQRLIDAEYGRDYAVRKIYSLLREYSDYNFQKSKEDAANALLKVFKSYGTGNEIAAMAQDVETAKLKNLIQDFYKEENETHFVTLDLVVALNELVNHNSSFVELQRKRKIDNAEFVPGVVKTARLEAENEFITLTELVNALSIVEGEENYSDLKQKTNNLLKEAMARAKQRTKKKEEETDPEVIE